MNKAKRIVNILSQKLSKDSGMALQEIPAWWKLKGKAMKHWLLFTEKGCEAGALVPKHFEPLVRAGGNGECWFGVVIDRTICISGHANEIHRQGRDSRYETMRGEIDGFINQTRSGGGGRECVLA